MIHYPIENTYWYTSEHASGFGTGADSFLGDYPQLVTLSGHIHLPNSDPQSIWQGDFTAVNVGDDAYHYFYPNNVYAGDSTTVFASRGNTSPAPAATETYNNDTSNGMILEIDGSVVTIKSYDFMSKKQTNQVWTFDVTKPRVYTNDRAASSLR